VQNTPSHPFPSLPVNDWTFYSIDSFSDATLETEEVIDSMPCYSFEETKKVEAPQSKHSNLILHTNEYSIAPEEDNGYNLHASDQLLESCASISSAKVCYLLGVYTGDSPQR
jgi:hypothetical protein